MPATNAMTAAMPTRNATAGADEVIAGELFRQVHLPRDLGDEQDRERRERAQDAVAHGALDRQEVGHHPRRVGGLRGSDPDPFQDHDGVQQERHGADPANVGELAGPAGRTA